jgi:hypothetical protein
MTDESMNDPPARPHGDPVHLPESLRGDLARLAAARGWSLDDAVARVLAEGVRRLSKNGARQDGAAPASSAAWRAVRPRGLDPGTGDHEWAEELLPTLPLRFQKYVSELLFDDERILYFLHRLSFTIRGRLPWRRERINEGLLIVTDRMLLFMEDAIPPGPMFVDWGYNAWITAIERVRKADVDAAGAACTLRVGCEAAGGLEERRLTFAGDQREPLAEAVALLNRFGDYVPGLPARAYGDQIPLWTTPAVRAARAKIAGRGQGEFEEKDIIVADAQYGDQRLRLSDGRLELIRGSRSESFAVNEISSVGVWRAITGCSLTFYQPQLRSLEKHSVVFQYPQSDPFLRVASRVRHVMGRRAAHG